MGNEIRITPGGFVTSKPRHMIGLSGASPFITSPFTIEGFQNLQNLYGDIAWPLLNSTGDPIQRTVTNWLGNDTFGGTNLTDVVTLGVYSRIVQKNVSDNGGIVYLFNNGEFAYRTGSASNLGTIASELFVTGGTVTLTAGSSTVVGAGTTWNADALAVYLGGNQSANSISRGDSLMVEASAGRWIRFLIKERTDNTHLEIYPTPTAGNPALGAGKTYKILRTGYNSYSNVEAVSPSGTTASAYFYYAGNLGWAKLATDINPHGTVECVFDTIATTAGHWMCPKTVDSAGMPVADVIADDVIMYKSFLLYGAGPAVSWTIPAFPSALPFGATDFPARNISIVDPTDDFVSFERLGDQVVALFEKSIYLVVPTGTVPEFTFYKMPELIGVIDATRSDAMGNAIYNHARPSTSGRGAVYYISNRGVESMGGGLAAEISAPVSSALRALFGQEPLTVMWDDAADTVMVRKGLGVDKPTALVYVPQTQQWSSLLYGPPVGTVVAALTTSIQTKFNASDHTRLIHYAYYETIKTPGTVATNGANIRWVAALLDENTPTAGLVKWQWITPTIPLGLEYPEFSTGGFVYDAYSLNSLPVTVDWQLWGGSSPYNLFLRDSNTMSFAGALPSPWISSRQRLSKKIDDAFVMLIFSSTAWVGSVAATLFDSKTQAMR